MNSANNFKKICLLIFAFLMTGIAAKAINAPYAEYEDGTLTFRYGAKPSGTDVFNLNENDIPSWVDKSLSITKIVFDASFAQARPTSCYYWFYGMRNLKSIEGLENLHTDNVTTMSGMFYDCKALSSLDLSGLNTQNVTEMGLMFYNCYGLTSLNLSGINAQNVTSMRMMFYNCYGLTSLNLSGINAQNVTDMSEMFYYCTDLTSLNLSGFKTQNVTNMSKMFCNCQSLTSLNLSGFNTQNVTSMRKMFSMCHGLTSLDLSGLNTSNVTDMSYMFEKCTGLTSIDLSSFNTSNVTYMQFMFDGCESLTSLDLSSFNTSNVTNMRYMFGDCTGLTSLDLSSLNTSNVKNMSYMFSGCSGFKSFDLSGFDTQTVTIMSGLFSGCTGLTSLDLSSLNTSNVTNMKNMFKDCSSLTSLDVSGFNTSNVTDMSSMFYDCSKLTTIYCYDAWSCLYSSDMFYGCKALKGAISYDSSKLSATYANPETGYFTYKIDPLLLGGYAVTTKGEQYKAGVVEGTVTFDPSTFTLYMKDATITGGTTYGIYSDMSSLNIVVEGNCTVTSTSSTALSSARGNLTFSGNGTLTLQGVTGLTAVTNNPAKGNEILIGDSVTLIVEGTNGNGIVGGTSNGTLYTRLKIENPNVTLKVKGANYDIARIGSLDLCEKIEVSSHEGTYLSSAGYLYDANGAIKNEWLTIETQKYALWICGKQFTSANSSGITVPNSQGTASYDAETSTLTLNGFGGYTQDSEPVLRSSIDGLVIKVIGTSTLLSTVGTTIDYSGRNLTITGDSLNLISNKEGIYMSNSLLPNNLNIQNVKNLYVVSFGAAVKGNVRVLRVNGRTLTGYLTTLNVSGPTNTLELSSGSPSLCDLDKLNLNDGLSVIIPLEAQFSGHKLNASDGTEATYAYIGKLGDANNDGSVTMADANMVVNYFLSTDKSDIKNFNRKQANVNGDSDITMADANAIVNLFLGQ